MTTQTLRATRASNNFRIWWTLAAVAGFVGGMTIKTGIEIAAEIGGFTAVLDAIPPILFGALLGAMLGICSGLAQWLVLRGRMAGASLWPLATFSASTLFWTLHNSGYLPFAYSPWGFVVQGFAHGAIVGATFGVAQWLVLRRQVSSAERWVLISAASWSAAGAIAHFLLNVLFAAANIHGPFDILIVSVLAAFFSGVQLQRLLEQPQA
jgi:hypothetical protein